MWSGDIGSHVQAAGLGQDQVVPGVEPAAAGPIEGLLAGELRQTGTIQGDAVSLGISATNSTTLFRLVGAPIKAPLVATMMTVSVVVAAVLGELLGEGSGAECATLVSNSLTVIFIERKAAGRTGGVYPCDQFVAARAVRACPGYLSYCRPRTFSG